MGKGITSSINASSGSISSVPLAPNITAATATPEFKLDSNDSAFGFGGVITLPSPGTPYAHFKAVRVTVFGPRRGKCGSPVSTKSGQQLLLLSRSLVLPWEGLASLLSVPSILPAPALWRLSTKQFA